MKISSYNAYRSRYFILEITHKNSKLEVTQKNIHKSLHPPPPHPKKNKKKNKKKQSYFLKNPKVKFKSLITNKSAKPMCLENIRGHRWAFATEFLSYLRSYFMLARLSNLDLVCGHIMPVRLKKFRSLEPNFVSIVELWFTLTDICSMHTCWYSFETPI